MTDYFDKEMEKLEKQQLELRKRQMSSDKDRYNTEEVNLDKHDYMRIINAHHKVAPETGQKLGNYLEKVIVHQEIAREKNWETHVDNQYKTWHTHKMPHCFMCEDTQFIGVLIQVLQAINHRYPKITF